MMFLATYGISSGGAFGNLLYQLENLGFFSYVLPFLMIFAIVFAILEKVQFLGTNKMVNVILSLAVSLMALQFQFVSYFFAEIFPRMGVLLSIILVLIILLGLFFNFKKKGTKLFVGILTFVGFIIILLQSFSDAFPWSADIFNGPVWWWAQNNLGTILTFVLLLGVLIGIPLAGREKTNKNPKFTLTDFVTDDN